MEIRNLSVGYGSKAILSNVSAHFEPGQLVCMTGNNGSGKSTLLRTLAGLQPYLDGEIVINNRHLSSYSRSELSRLISIVTTTRDLPGNLSAREVISMGRSPYTGFFGTLSKIDKKIVDDAINIIGIDHLAEKPVSQLSDGELQKVMIAKSLAQDTPFILLDEPTAFLDFNSKKALYSLLRKLVDEENKLIIFSSHDLPLALDYSTDEFAI